MKRGAEYDYGGVKKKAGKTDWQAAAAYVIQNGMLSREELEGRGFIYSGKRDNQYDPTQTGSGKSGNPKEKVAPYKTSGDGNKAPYLK